jgi:hypothetical protein
MKTEAVTPADNREPEAGGKPAKANWVRASSGSGRLCALCRRRRAPVESRPSRRRCSPPLDERSHVRGRTGRRALGASPASFPSPPYFRSDRVAARRGPGTAFSGKNSRSRVKDRRLKTRRRLSRDRRGGSRRPSQSPPVNRYSVGSGGSRNALAISRAAFVETTVRPVEALVRLVGLVADAFASGRWAPWRVSRQYDAG